MGSSVEWQVLFTMFTLLKVKITACKWFVHKYTANCILMQQIIYLHEEAVIALCLDFHNILSVFER